MWFLKWAKSSSGVLPEAEFRAFLSKELERLEEQPRVLNVACFELRGLEKLEPPLAASVITHVRELLKAELRKREVLAHTNPNQFALFLPDSSPDEAQSKLSQMQLEVQGAMQLYHLSVAMNASLFSFDKPLGLVEVVGVVDALLLEANAAGENVMLQEVSVAPKSFSAPFTVRPSRFDKLSNLI
jgi:GGDEF domain-containing protein